MKTLFATLILTLLIGTNYAAANGRAAIEPPSQLEMAQRFSVYLPQTLVVRRDRLGNVAIYHSDEKLMQGQPLTRSLPFTSRFKTKPEDEAGAQWSGWNFYWNYGYSYSYPTYGFYNPYYGFRYNYYYSPYYNYYDPYDHYYYYYYGWRRW